MDIELGDKHSVENLWFEDNSSIGKPISTAVCGFLKSFMINSKRDVYSFGFNKGGCLGHNRKSIALGKIPNLSNIKMISLTYSSTTCLDMNGRVFTFGYNDGGLLGVGDKIKKYTYKPQKVELPLIKQIASADQFTIFLSNQGDLYLIGSPLHILSEQGGIIFIPKKIPNIKNIEFIECGRNHVICKDVKFNFYSWGKGIDGQLGHGDFTSYSSPELCKNWPNDIIDVKCGGTHSLLLLSTGKVMYFGFIFYLLEPLTENVHRVTLPTLLELHDIKKMESGLAHSLFIDTSNQLWLFGLNSSGELGLPADITYVKKPIKHPTLSNIIDISNGGSQTFVKTSSYEIFAFGNNCKSELSIKSEPNLQIYSPCKVLSDGDFWATFNGRSKQKSSRK